MISTMRSVFSIFHLRYEMFFAMGLIASVAAQRNSPDPISDFCRRHKHQTCVIDSRLYIDGSLVHYGASVAARSVAERSTYVTIFQLIDADSADTWLLWEDLSDLGTGLPHQYKNLTKACVLLIALHVS